MKKVLLICSLLFGTMMAHAQYESHYETIKSPDEDEVIYKGTVTFDDIDKVKAFELQQQALKYKAAPDPSDYLSAHLNQYDLVIFLGTWCEDSHRLIPQLYRVLEDCGYTFLRLKMYALDREKKGLNHIEEDYHITNVPTIIVMQKDGKEKGRITETVNQSIEADLEAIIKK
jgi:thiol-disulfide isomerase/thioredoxin